MSCLAEAMRRNSTHCPQAAERATTRFCEGARQGRFPKLDDRYDVWQILVMIAERKVIDLFHYEGRAKRGGGRVLDEGALPDVSSTPQRRALERVAGREPSPEFAAQVAEQLGRLLEALGDIHGLGC